MSGAGRGVIDGANVVGGNLVLTFDAANVLTINGLRDAALLSDDLGLV